MAKVLECRRILCGTTEIPLRAARKFPSRRPSDMNFSLALQNAEIYGSVKQKAANTSDFLLEFWGRISCYGNMRLF
jgi:hypothetical protein